MSKSLMALTATLLVSLTAGQALALNPQPLLPGRHASRRVMPAVVKSHAHRHHHPMLSVRKAGGGK